MLPVVTCSLSRLFQITNLQNTQDLKWLREPKLSQLAIFQLTHFDIAILFFIRPSLQQPKPK